MEKISYEHRDYESVDDKSLSWAISQKLWKTELVTDRVKCLSFYSILIPVESYRWSKRPSVPVNTQLNDTSSSTRKSFGCEQKIKKIFWPKIIQSLVLFTRSLFTRSFCPVLFFFLPILFLLTPFDPFFFFFLPVFSSWRKGWADSTETFPFFSFGLRVPLTWKTVGVDGLVEAPDFPAKNIGGPQWVAVWGPLALDGVDHVWEVVNEVHCLGIHVMETDDLTAHLTNSLQEFNTNL